ncbi:uncharacterized protein LOC133465985 isoform X1 [Phyllopteryx taeniolatus]|uniref:uncharacterized protein LOC133465985 isoform X1 n=2 Tax=Phyllopteryx taeniolatus TaxID=161469 RepID=UPI002AD3552C|nr:uncharacterized protein LOC133465985 isoform X1 [Phyllopteryx taeniolatus]
MVQVETWGEADDDTFPNTEDKFENEAHLDNKVGDEIQQGHLAKPLRASKSNGMTLMQHCNVPTEFFKNKENMTTQAFSKPNGERQTETKENAEHFHTDSTDSLVESDKGTREVQVHTEAFGKVHLTPSNEKQNKGRRAKHRDEFWRIASDILQGEQLLQRLQLVQQRQEADMCTCREVNHEREHEEKCMTKVDLAASGGDLSGEDEKKEIRFHKMNCDCTKTSLLEREKTEETGSREAQEKTPAQPEHHDIATKEADDSDDTASVSWVCADWIPINSIETISTPTSLRSSCHRFSVTETSMERPIHEDVQGKQNLQRAGGILNLADDPDVLEIPFNTNIVFELLPTKIGPGQDRERQFSEQMMPEDGVIRESGRRLGTSAQGETPKEQGKGEAHQLKKTQLLFEAFRQENTQGPTRLRKPLSTSMTDQVYPTVLERTRSLDMFSTSEKVKSSENLQSKIPSGGSRDRARLSPYPKQEKNVLLSRSSDSISSDVSTQVEESGKSVGMDKVKQEATMLEQNPFFKLRPALALKPEVEKEIRDAKAREDELRRQRRTLYGEKRQSTEEGDKLPRTSTVIPGIKQQSRGKLERLWPPPCKKEQLKSEKTQGPSVHRAGSQRSHLWQRWEFGRINGQPSAEKD